MQEFKPEFFREVAKAAILLAEKIRDTGLCDEVGESVYFQVLSNEWETFGDETPSIAQLSEHLAKVENDARAEGEKQGVPVYLEDFENDEEVIDFIIKNNNGNQASPHEKYRKLWGVETAEESFVLKALLGSRINITGDFTRDEADRYHDPKALKPTCIKKMEAVRTKFRELESLRDKFSLLDEHVEDFISLKREFYEVIEKHKLEVTPSKEKWLGVHSVEEIAAIEPKPIDLERVINWYIPDEVARSVFEAHLSDDAGLLDVIRCLFLKIPDIFFVRARETMSRCETIKPEVVAFKNWLLDQAGTGIFRSEIVGEIDRQWPKKYSEGAIMSKEIFKKLEKSGDLVKAKKQGKIFYTTS